VRLELALPPDWIKRQVAPRTVIDLDSAGQVTIDLEPRRTLHAFSPLSVLESDRPPGATIRRVREPLEMLSRHGWPMTLVLFHVEDAAGALVEARLGAVYTMTHYAGVALVRARPPERMDEVRERVLEVLQCARPRFREREPATLREFWSDRAP